jgi:phosphohistidine swiveling domain-containing protein
MIDRLRDGDLPRATKQAMLDGRPDHLDDVPEPVRELGLLAQELTFWKTERLDVLALADARAGQIYHAVAELLGLDVERLFAMRRDEIADSLRAGEPTVDMALLDERLAGYCLLLDHQQIAFCQPSRQPVVSETPSASDGRIVGIAASPGVVTGTARIIRDLVDIARLEPGDVLVTAMTRPEMGAALDRAAAFVTDQGGLMSHAAIISREMRKPCVIGTEVATQRLADGTRVTVDGDNGVVTLAGEDK